MNVKRLKVLCTELYKTINKYEGPIKLPLTKRPTRKRYKMNMVFSQGVRFILVTVYENI